MDKDVKYRMFRREFLNLPGHNSGAHVLASVEDSSNKAMDEKYVSGDSTLEIADCYRKIAIDTNTCHDSEEIKNQRHKMNLLIETMVQFREALFAELDLQEIRLVNYAAKKAAEAKKSKGKAKKRKRRSALDQIF